MKINGYRNRGNGQVIMVDPIEGETLGPATSEWEPVWVVVSVMPPLVDPAPEPAGDATPPAQVEEAAE